MRYFIFLKYRGTRYHGWQRQPRAISVQEIIEDALTFKLSEKISVTGAGRTDTGVHAEFYAAHFDSESNNLHQKSNLIFRLNRFLPDDIAVTGIRMAIPDASARYGAVSRTYRYRIARVKNPFITETALLYTGSLDTNAMNEAAGLLTQYNDFASFCRADSDARTTICKVSEAFWKDDGDILEFTITADRFLRNMVRAVAGTLLDIGKGRSDCIGFRQIIEARDRKRAGQSAPAHGLSLTNIVYPDNLFIH